MLTREPGGHLRAGEYPAKNPLPKCDSRSSAFPPVASQTTSAVYGAELLSPQHWVAEIIYFPAETALLKLARRRGCRTLSGLGMAVNQAVRAFELFTGRAPDRTAMARHFAEGGP